MSTVVSRIGDIPPFTRILSGTDDIRMIRLPASSRRYFCVIETGLRRAQFVCTDPVAPDLHLLIITARAALSAENYRVEPENVICPSDVIEQLNDFTAPQEPEEPVKLGSEENKSQSRLLFEHWLSCAVEERATDLHIQVMNNKAEVKLRIDGELSLLNDESGGVYTSVRAERAVAWAFNNASHRGSNSNSQFTIGENLYCMIEPREVAGRRVSLRFQSIRGATGVKVVCRLLDVSQDQPTLTYEQLGYEFNQITALKRAASLPSGFVLFAGVTGSGKTTSLKTFIETHPDNGRDAFYSVEDPVEYPLKGVHQIPVQRDLLDKAGSALKYSEVIAALMRADPGCVLMGEIRDEATASAGQQIVETGHMACATVHAHLISGIVPRLTDSEIGMSRYVLTNPHILSLLCYQSLVPRLCVHCRLSQQDCDPNHAEFKQISAVCEAFERYLDCDSSGLLFRNPAGCPQCRNRGTRGLTVVAELFVPDRHWLSLIRERRDQEAIDYYRSFSDGNLSSSDMTGKTVFEHSVSKAMRGIIDPRVCARFENFDLYEKKG
jgi:general secretion pathway protein E